MTALLSSGNSPSDGRFLGVPWMWLARYCVDGWSLLRDGPLLLWLASPLAGILHNGQGKPINWTAGCGDPRPLTGKAPLRAQFQALALPEELYLSRVLALPAMAPTDREMAIALQVQASSPFHHDDLVWGYASAPHLPADEGEMHGVHIVLASRQQIQSYVQGLSLPPEAGPFELWAFAGEGDQPVVFRGFGEFVRQRGVARVRRVHLSLLVLALVLVGAVAASPLVRLRMVAIDAIRQSDELAGRTRSLVQQREALTQTSQRLEVVRRLGQEHLAPLEVMSMLTRALPDDTSLISVRIEGHKIALAGQTVDAAAVMQLLSNQPGIRDVRAPSPATRPLGAPKESFTIEFLWGPAPPAETPAQGAAGPDRVGPTKPAQQGASAPASAPRQGASA